MKKKKQKIKSYPKKLQLSQYFATPIWSAEEPCFVDSLNKASDSYIEESKKRYLDTVEGKNKSYG